MLYKYTKCRELADAIVRLRKISPAYSFEEYSTRFYASDITPKYLYNSTFNENDNVFRSLMQNITAWLEAWLNDIPKDTYRVKKEAAVVGEMLYDFIEENNLPHFMTVGVEEITC